jgi:hypothetical protein
VNARPRARSSIHVYVLVARSSCSKKDDDDGGRASGRAEAWPLYEISMKFL